MSEPKQYILLGFLSVLTIVILYLGAQWELHSNWKKDNKGMTFKEYKKYIRDNDRNAGGYMS